MVRAVCLALLVVSSPALPAAATVAAEPATWPEDERAFLQDGPGLLLDEATRRGLLAMAADERAAFVARFLADPSPETPGNELRAAIDRRRELAFGFADSPGDVRWQVAFLLGAPAQRLELACSAAFRPVELWQYGERWVLLFESSEGGRWRLWDRRLFRKADLYTEEFAALMEGWERYNGVRFNAVRFDLQVCRPEAQRLDDVTRVRGLSEVAGEPRLVPQPLAPPAALAEWTAAALAEPVAAAEAVAPALALQGLGFGFPSRQGGERILTRASLAVAPGAALGVDTSGERPLVRLAVTAVVERDGVVFDRQRLRYSLAPPEAGAALPLVLEVPLRPGRAFVLRLHVRDEVTGAAGRLAGGFVVPREPAPVADAPVPQAEIADLEAGLASRRLPGADSLLLVPPGEDVVLGRWRAEALVSGERIVKVVLLLDGRPVVTVNRPPFGAELPLGELPSEHVVRAEGYDAQGVLVAADELALNLPRGQLRVRILEPRRGAAAGGRTRARAVVVVPEGRAVERVEFLVDGEPVATDTAPPWEHWLELPERPGELAYLTVVAHLDDGQRAEDVRFLGGGSFVEEMEIDLVELYTAVVDGAGRLVGGLAEADFTVREDGRPQAIRRFEVAEDLPLTVGIALDVSGSMEDKIEEAKLAAAGFVAAVVRPGDRAFAVRFADGVEIVQPPTDDVGALVDLIGVQKAYGGTALHDAVVTSLYYFRGFAGQKALILLSDGDDTASAIAFRQAREYARRSGVAIYAIGLGVSGVSFAIRDKLTSLARETGGRAFFVATAGELTAVYGQIEQELRTRYLLAYVSDQGGRSEEWRRVEVAVARRGLTARTIRGYYP